MQTGLEELAHSYKELSDEELLDLHASGGLTEVAYNALETELSRREIPLPPAAGNHGDCTRKPSRKCPSGIGPGGAKRRVALSRDLALRPLRRAGRRLAEDRQR